MEVSASGLASLASRLPPLPLRKEAKPNKNAKRVRASSSGAPRQGHRNGGDKRTPAGDGEQICDGAIWPLLCRRQSGASGTLDK